MRSSARARSLLVFSALVGACSGDVAHGGAGLDGITPAAAPDAGTSGQSPSATSPGELGSPVDPAGLPNLGCDTRSPPGFAALCAGCHHGTGTAYPDLFAFTGSAEAFAARVRSGGDGMPRFDARALDDAALTEIYHYLQAGSSAESSTLGSAQPLFGAPSAVTPVVFVRDDGVLITRAAGRVRGRHELEGTYGPFGPHYFEDRTYGFIVEDYTVLGESLIRVSYLPVAVPQDKTNFRAFKIYGDGNVFHANTGMDTGTALPSLSRDGVDVSGAYAAKIAPYARVQSHEVTRNAREERALAEGDTFEFEFGVFLDPADVRPDSRTAYYTDTFRYRVGVGGLTPDNADTSGRPGPVARAWQGGGSTLAWLYAEPETSFSQMALDTQHEHVQSFVEGRRLFHTDFATGEHSEPGNPRFDEQAGKAGPLLVSTRCETCHVLNGGGRTPTAALDATSSLTFKLYGASGTLGTQLQLQEGSALFSAGDSHAVTLADGSAVVLTKPRFALQVDGSYERASPRIARRLLGLGLLEAIDEQTLLAQADPEDCDADGVSGRPHFVVDPRDGKTRLGRFGWRAEKVSVEHQVADALAVDMGVQTPLFPGPGGEAELSADDLARLTTYMRLIGVPAQRDTDAGEVQAGELLFRSIGCANCHVPELTTAENHPFVELRGQQIRPYTDLLLHDLGPELADAGGESRDGESNEAASASEWRTAPLWGVGLSQQVQGYVALLHDGRAHSVLEAVLWHGGEATRARERVQELGSADRQALIRFVESL